MVKMAIGRTVWRSGEAESCAKVLVAAQVVRPLELEPATDPCPCRGAVEGKCGTERLVETPKEARVMSSVGRVVVLGGAV